MDKLVGAFSGVLKTSNTPASQSVAQQGDRQYLRLPLESARKLRWFEKADLQALTKSHLREKRDLLDTLIVLKKLLVRHGLDEAKLDVEVAAHLRTAKELAEEHEGVASVLLASLEYHVQQLRFENERLQATIRLGQQTATTSNPGCADGKSSEAAGRREMEGSPPSGDVPHNQIMTSVTPLPRRLEHLDLAHANCNSSARTDSLLKQQVAALETQCTEYAKEVSELKTALAKQQQQQTAAMNRRRDANAPVQDILLSLQEAAREEARKASLADARATRLEGELKTVQAQHKAVLKENAALQQQVVQLREEVEKAATATRELLAEAEAAGEGSKAAAEALEEAAALRQANASLKTELISAQSRMSKLEADLQLAQQREAASAVAMSEAEALARRTDELATANMQLMQRLGESRAELEMAAYYKKVCGELTETKSRLEEQLLGLGSLLSASEHRLADMAARASMAEEHAALAECRARTAESSMAAEVERRCAAVLSSRALWPPALQAEVEAMEARLAKAEAVQAAAEQRALDAVRAEETLREELNVKAAELAILTRESSAATTAFAAQLQQLREALAESQARAAGLQDDLAESRAREEAATAAAAAAAAAPLHTRQRRHSSGGNANTSSATTTAVMTPKWQIQNKVGGGGLYNLDAAALVDAVGSGNSNGGSSSSSKRLLNVEIAGGKAGVGGGGGAGAGAQANVDALYMKNVLFKFLEAHLTNKVQEREMLLPAVATLLQATQEEYIALQKILRATMPPSRQMLSVFGLSR